MRTYGKVVISVSRKWVCTSTRPSRSDICMDGHTPARVRDRLPCTYFSSTAIKWPPRCSLSEANHSLSSSLSPPVIHNGQSVCSCLSLSLPSLAQVKAQLVVLQVCKNEHKTVKKINRKWLCPCGALSWISYEPGWSKRVAVKFTVNRRRSFSCSLDRIEGANNHNQNTKISIPNDVLQLGFTYLQAQSGRPAPAASLNDLLNDRRRPSIKDAHQSSTSFS